MGKAVRGSCWEVGAGGATALARATFAWALLALVALAALPRAGVAQGSLGGGTLLVAGTTLVVSPESQTVPFDTPTIVNTALQGYDAAQGTLPPDLRVVGDFTGPEIDGAERVNDFETATVGI